MPTLTAGDDTDAVRSLIDTSLGTGDISDTTILSDIYAGRACDRVSQWVARLGANLDDADPGLHRAAILLTAAYIARSYQQTLSETLPDYSYRRQPSKDDPSTLANDLAEQAMSTVVDAASNVSYPQPITFGMAAGRRGWSSFRTQRSGLSIPNSISPAWLWQNFGSGVW